jgi:YHS domain-containing protein
MGLGHWLFHPKLIIDLPPCPVGAGKINFAKSLTTEQGPVFFHCGHCLDQFTVDPERYEQTVAVQREALDALPRVQVKCPISGNTVDASVFVEYEGREVYFCSKDCPARFQEEPSKFRGKLAASYCYQTKCPVADQEIDPRIFATMSGGATIYFCAEECRETFLESPRKYRSNLIKQGYRIDL